VLSVGVCREGALREDFCCCCCGDWCVSCLFVWASLALCEVVSACGARGGSRLAW